MSESDSVECLHAYTLTFVHAYMHVRTCLHAYMHGVMRYALFCLDTTVYQHAYVLTYLLTYLLTYVKHA